jgi:hypothetical protein
MCGENLSSGKSTTPAPRNASSVSRLSRRRAGSSCVSARSMPPVFLNHAVGRLLTVPPINIVILFQQLQFVHGDICLYILNEIHDTI